MPSPIPLPPELRADLRRHQAVRPMPVAPKGEPPVPEIIAAHPLRAAHWRYVTESLAELGVLAVTDEGALTAYVVARCDLEHVVKLQDRIDAGEDPNEVLLGSGVATVKDASMRLRAARQDTVRFAAELGLSPSSRSRVSRIPDQLKSGTDDGRFGL